MIKVAGSNAFNSIPISSGSVSKSVDIISPPASLKIDPRCLLSYSHYYQTTVWVNLNHRAYTIGLNTESRIHDSLPHNVISEPVEIKLKDKDGIQLTILSVWCSEKFTVYLAKRPTENGPAKIIYFHANRKSHEPYYADLSGRNPIALFGGVDDFAVIDDHGIIIAFTNNEKTFNQPQFKSLPNNDRAVSVACCRNFFIALSENGKIFQAQNKVDKLADFKEVRELRNKTIEHISGIATHCFCVSTDGEVFARGENTYYQLGVSRNEHSRCSTFMHIEMPEQRKIAKAFAGDGSSLFLTEDGQIFACGRNKLGQLLTLKPSKQHFLETITETIIQANATFCMIGINSTVFVGCEPPANQPNQIAEFNYRNINH